MAGYPNAESTLETDVEQAQTDREADDSLELSDPNDRRYGMPAERSIRESEIEFRLLVENVQDVAVFLMNPEGIITSWNEGAVRVKGFTPEDAIGNHYRMVYTEDEAAARLPEKHLQQALREGKFVGQGWRRHKVKGLFWAEVVLTPLWDEDSNLRGFGKITRDMTDRKRLEDDLRARVEELAEADRQRNEFLAMLAHELRNPLAPIVNCVHLVRAHACEDPALRKAGEVVDRQVGQMRRLLNDLLDVSRVTHGNIQVRRELLDLRDVVRNAVETARPAVDGPKHQLSVLLPLEPLCVSGDALRLEQVLVNLLTNAAKYTELGGRISVTVEQIDHHAQVTVRDNGAGIPPDLLPHVFNLFVQGRRALARTQGGLGIGLTIAQRLIELHGGAIEARSSGEGRGSEFIVRLPLHQSAPSTVEHASARPEARDDGNRVCVLVVDDNVDAAETLADLIQFWGYDVRHVHSGPAALEAAHDLHPHAILLDIGLPGVDGYQVARRLRDEPCCKDSLLVAITGYSSEEDRRRSREVGIQHHMVKPVDPGSLRELLKNLP